MTAVYDIKKWKYRDQHSCTKYALNNCLCFWKVGDFMCHKMTHTFTSPRYAITGQLTKLRLPVDSCVQGIQKMPRHNKITSFIDCLFCNIYMLLSSRLSRPNKRNAHINVIKILLCGKEFCKSLLVQGEICTSTFVSNNWYFSKRRR